MRILFLSAIGFILSSCSTPQLKNGSEEQRPAASESSRVIQLWDNQVLKVRFAGGKWQADPTDVASAKKSLFQKITEGKYKSLGKEIAPNQLVKAFGRKIQFDETGESTVSFFIRMAKTQTPFVYPQDVNITDQKQSYDTFLSALTAHVKTVNQDIGSVKTSEGKSVLEGYFVIASNEYEIAFMQWNAKVKPVVFDRKNGHTLRTGPQGTILFESNLVWEDPAVKP